MFSLKDEKPALTTGELRKLVIAYTEEPPNADIEYATGYMDNGDFIQVGIENLFLQDSDFDELIQKIGHKVEQEVRKLLKEKEGKP